MSETPTVLVVGANGFLGGHIAAALRRRGCQVLRGVRAPRGDDERCCDLMRLEERDCLEALAGVDVVVNAAGILREENGQTFKKVHVAGPLALAQACVAGGVRRFVQVSSLGVPEDGEFVASKHRFDGQLQALPIASVVLRPSVVYSASGSYGGTSLLRALAALPWRQWLPGDGRWLVQPVDAGDLGDIVAAAVRGDATGLYDVGGPEPMSLREYQSEWRRWLRIPGERAVEVPEALVSAQVALWERIGSGPVGTTMWRMLRRSNITAPDAAAKLSEAFGIAPRALSAVLATQPSQVQDRWQAQLYFLAPLLRISVVMLWLLSAAAGLLAPATQIEQLSGDTALSLFAPVALARVGGVIDAILALWLLSGRKPRMTIALMVAIVAAYTVILGSTVPALWLEPLGGLAKNLVVLPALAVLWVLADRR